MAAGVQPFEVQGVVGGQTQLDNGSGGQSLTLEFTGLRTINVENFSDQAGASGADVRKVDLRASIDARMGAGHKTTSNKELRNVGPSVTYKLRDASGQAREYHNYMLPVDMGEGAGPVFLLVCATPPLSLSATCVCLRMSRAAWTDFCACVRP